MKKKNLVAHEYLGDTADDTVAPKKYWLLITSRYIYQ